MEATMQITPKYHMQSILLLVIVGTSACGGLAHDPKSKSEDSIGIAAAALTNPSAFTEVDYSAGNCDELQRSKIDAAVAILHNQFVVDPQPMIDCIKEAVIPVFVYQEAEGAYSEWIVEKITRTAPPIPVSCETPPGAFIGQAKWDGVHIVIPPSGLSNISVPALAAVIGHEVGHMFGFGESKEGTLEYLVSASMQIQECSTQISNGATPPKPKHWSNDRLSDFPDEVALQTVGDAGGVRAYTLLADRDFRSTCPNRLFAAGITGTTSTDGVNSVQMSCTDTESSSSGVSPLVGDTVGFPFQGGCSAGQVMVGLWGQGGIFVNSIGPVCEPASEVVAGTQTTLSYGTRYGAENVDDPTWKRVCPAGMAVRSLRGHFGVGASGAERKMNSLQVVCQSAANPRSLDIYYSGGWSPNPSPKPWTSSDCPGRGAVDLLTVAWRPEYGVEYLGGWCSIFTGSAGNVQREAHFPALSGVGLNPSGMQSTSYDKCLDGDVLVGLNVNLDITSAFPVRGVQGVCAKASDWAQLSNPNVPTYTLPARGPFDGWWGGEWRCAQSMFVSGFRGQSDLYFGMFDLACRSFGFEPEEEPPPCECVGTGPNGVPVTASCGESACGSDYMTYSCSASGWSWTGQPCDCTCSGTGP
ncbi:MAG: hypothetical protein JW940_03370, partial [Polyangiaceae bacterium]|nr:hypothetical protein [Polyangiaceae bacterium]